MTFDAEIRCPHCGRLNDAHTGLDTQVPEEGDVAVCWGCRKPAIYVRVLGALAQRVPTAEEEQEIAADVAHAQLAMEVSDTPLQAARVGRRT